jgi:toxin ParE1/3/4
MPAVNQLENIFDFIAEENPAAAERTIRRIHQAIIATSRMPNSGRIGRVAGTREIIVTGTRYVVAYRVLGKTIQVLAVFHGAQKWPESF